MKSLNPPFLQDKAVLYIQHQKFQFYTSLCCQHAHFKNECGDSTMRKRATENQDKHVIGAETTQCRQNMIKERRHPWTSPCTLTEMCREKKLKLFISLAWHINGGALEKSIVPHQSQYNGLQWKRKAAMEEPFIISNHTSTRSTVRVVLKATSEMGIRIVCGTAYV
ncbi:unnamed protein product [Sphenostylis stenocarpa]|uniref:Uncharacterized protein n=1 Tax=Sphenostylis stenocarpa TaxID=92480 RepID=A0AA86S5V5_9FABA|nr:unnamed protein product [Sphenostylis stenocarpa]